MIKLSILYPNIEGSRFDIDYYVNVHMPMSIEKLSPALRGVSVEEGLKVPEVPGVQPPYVAAAYMLFESLDAFMAAFTPHAGVLQGDMPNYTDIQPVYQFSEVRISRSF